MIVRAVKLDDLDQLWSLLEHATYGMTTLQITREQLSERVEHSNFAFQRTTEKPSGEPYVFVMEDLQTKKLVGLSCIFSKTGGYEPFYSYRRVVEQNYCEPLQKTVEVESLHLTKIHDGPTEIGSLFLLPDYRAKGRGRLLSLSRFAFIAAHPKRFDSEVIAEMRGVMSDDGSCPFWEAIGRHFFGMDFPQADSLSTINKSFIEDLMPNHPIYSCLLADSTRAIMGQVHPNTKPALAMLKSEGFAVTDLIDIFDGGPVVSCQRDAIQAVQRTQLARVAEVVDAPQAATSIVATTGPGFRATLGQAQIVEPGHVVVDAATAQMLRVGVSDCVRLLSLYPENTTK